MNSCNAQRHWTDFLSDQQGVSDPSFPELYEKDAMKITQEPSSVPTSQPSVSMEPSTTPSAMPSSEPSTNPTSVPSLHPTKMPSSIPTISFSPTHDLPSKAYRYNPFARRGPENWHKVNIRDNEYEEYKELTVSRNMCDEYEQSPIDLYHNAKCVEHHQIRSRVSSDIFHISLLLYRSSFKFLSIPFIVLSYTAW